MTVREDLISLIHDAFSTSTQDDSLRAYRRALEKCIHLLTIPRNNTSPDDWNLERVLQRETDNEHDEEIRFLMKHFLLWGMTRNEHIGILGESTTTTDGKKSPNILVGMFQLLALILENCGGKWLILEQQPPKELKDASKSLQGSSNVKSMGKTICAFIQLAAGELRIQLGLGLEMMAMKQRQDDATRREGIIMKDVCSIVGYCTRIISRVTGRMVELATDLEEREENGPSSILPNKEGKLWNTWGDLPFDAMLHIKHSLDDAHDAMFQFMADECVSNLIQQDTMADDDIFCVIGIMLSRCIGGWLAETDIEELPSTSKDVVERSFLNSTLLCHRLGDQNTQRASPASNGHPSFLANAEPLLYLLPSILKLVESESMPVLKNNNQDLDIGLVTVSLMDRVSHSNRDNHFLSQLGWAFLLLKELNRQENYFVTTSRKKDHDIFIRCIDILTKRLLNSPTLPIESLLFSGPSPLAVSLCHAVQFYFRAVVSSDRSVMKDCKYAPVLGRAIVMVFLGNKQQHFSLEGNDEVLVQTASCVRSGMQSKSCFDSIMTMTNTVDSNTCVKVWKIMKKLDGGRRA